jgi:DNA-binding MarR family transcriptional regulator
MNQAEQLRYLVLAVQREGNRALTAALKPLNVSPSQAEAIRIIGQHRSLNLQGIGELLICESGTNPSRLIDRLVNTGLAVRSVSAADRRQILLSLTKAGETVNRKIAAIEGELYQQIDHAVDSSDMAATIRAMHPLVGGTSAGDSFDKRFMGLASHH